MARVRSINKYPLIAYAELYAAARLAADAGGTFGLPCTNYKEAETRRFELYAFLRALSRSTAPGHAEMLKEFQSFKLTLFRTGNADEALLRFISYDTSDFARDIKKYVETFKAELPPQPPQPPQPPVNTVFDPSGQTQMDVFLKLGYGVKPK